MSDTTTASITSALPSGNIKPYAKVVADSVAAAGDRVTTFEVNLHRFVLAELNTHRVFSRNSASSRAIPVEKQLDKIVNHPAWPLEWPAERPGMQGGVTLEGDDLDDAQMLFRNAWAATTALIRDYISTHPEKESRLHKSLINRLLEPFMWQTVILTATEWDGWYAQRANHLAQPEIRVAAELMQDAFAKSTPTEVAAGGWHLPYIRGHEGDAFWRHAASEHLGAGDNTTVEIQKRVSVARCARVSYLTHDGTADVAKDLALYDRLVTAKPAHWSPLEHVTTPCAPCTPLPPYGIGGHTHLGNFRGWTQLRSIVEREQLRAIIVEREQLRAIVEREQ